jgi:hypothetical protein
VLVAFENMLPAAKTFLTHLVLAVFFFHAGFFVINFLSVGASNFDPAMIARSIIDRTTLSRLLEMLFLPGVFSLAVAGFAAMQGYHRFWHCLFCGFSAYCILPFFTGDRNVGWSFYLALVAPSYGFAAFVGWLIARRFWMS